MISILADGIPWTDADGRAAWPGREAGTLAAILADAGYTIETTEEEPVIEKLPTEALERKRDEAEAAGDWPTFERAEAELERRDYDASDPAVVAEREQRMADNDGEGPAPWWAAY